jgi:NADH-quinone oxidoreductase subunit N
LQKKDKRIQVYSNGANLGINKTRQATAKYAKGQFYAFLGTPQGRWQAVLFYIVAYSAANLLAFSMIPVHEDDATRDRLDTLDGLFHRDPMAASLIAVAMLSLAGLPPFPGFTAKFVIFCSVVAAGFSTYALLGLLGSFLGLFFYLRVIQRMFMRESTVSAAVPPRAITGVGLARMAGVLCLAATLLLTILPHIDIQLNYQKNILLLG